MPTYDSEELKSLLKQHNTKPNKILGQNFLIDKEVLSKIIEAAKLKSKDTVVEIGPGIGILTTELAKITKRVIAIEKDAKMCGILKDILQKNNINNVEIIHNDILKIKANYGKYKVVANIPYYITQPIIRLFLESANPPQEIILLVQKEVAQRICNKKKLSLLAISVQLYADPEIIHYVRKSAFWPAPKVDSAILRIKCGIPETPHKVDRDKFFKIVKAGFSAPRKVLISNLFKKLKIPREKLTIIFEKTGINKNARAENLSVEEWKVLTKILFPK